MTTQAGIGTTKRKRVEKEKNRTGNVPLADHLDPTVSIYLSGLPVDGSIAEGFIGRLFSSYGTIKNVHFYRHKPTGELKGDGLLLFESKPKDKERLLQSVCSQVRGEWFWIIQHSFLYSQWFAFDFLLLFLVTTSASHPGLFVYYNIDLTKLTADERSGASLWFYLAG